MNALLIILAVFTVVGILLYNTLIARKNQVENVYGSLEALLKKRYDLIPNLVESAKRYMEFEKDILTEIVALRTKAVATSNIGERMDLENRLSRLIKGLMINIENYPQLKSDTHIMHLQRSLNEIEEQISAARRAYNQAVTDYNNIIEMFPTNILANYMGYRKKEVFKIDEDEKNPPDIKTLFDR